MSHEQVAAAAALDQMGFSSYVLGESGRGLMRNAREFMAQESRVVASIIGKQIELTAGMDLVDEPLDSIDVSVLIGATALRKASVPFLGPSSFFLIPFLVTRTALLQLLRAFLLVASVIPQRSVEPLAGGFALRFVSTTSESQRTEQPPGRLRLVRFPAGRGCRFVKALGRDERRGDELLSQPLERQRLPIQYR
ncbi:hypothetical protein ABZ707_20380 [Streptomyces sp. NPDC006923]|uniref:hypothetical protein n=1 Tax=Streptomyces sp. NPDC006923 TaxID=3155355 RepID=UPI00340069AE